MRIVSIPRRAAKRARGLIVQTALAVMVGGVAHAASSSAGSSTLPFMGPLEIIEQTVSGPFAYALTIIGLVMAGAGLVFFGEMGKFVERLLYVVLAGSMLLGATQIVGLFSGAVV